MQTVLETWLKCKRAVPTTQAPGFVEHAKRRIVIHDSDDEEQQVCRNCKCRPVAKNGKCGFLEWCAVCDDSLCSTRPQPLDIDENAAVMCSNCKCHPVAINMKCGFEDWCAVCDDSLYSTRPQASDQDDNTAAAPIMAPHSSIIASGSDDSDNSNGPIRRRARIAALPAAAKHQEQRSRIGKENVAPADGICVLMRTGNQHQHNAPSEGSNEFNLWKATPRRISQYLDVEAQHVPGDTTSGSSDSDGSSITSGFISTDEATITLNDAEIMKQTLPHTARLLGLK